MEQRTFDIIMACKGVNDKEHEHSAYERVIDYMISTCGCDRSLYTVSAMNYIMRDALCDYLNTCDNPGAFMRSIYGIINREQYSFGEQVAIAFELIQVRQDDRYINGFGKYLDDIDLSDAAIENLTSELVTDISDKLNALKNYQVRYDTPQNGKMIVHYKDTNFVLNIGVLDKKTFEECMECYGKTIREV